MYNKRIFSIPISDIGGYVVRIKILMVNLIPISGNRFVYINNPGRNSIKLKLR